MSKSDSMNSSNTLDSKPYWTSDCLRLSNQLLSLTETGCVGSDLNSSNTWQTNTTAQSWFSTTLRLVLKPNLPKIVLPSFTSSPPVLTATDETLVRSKKIRIYPKPLTVRIWNRYTGLSRYWFNQALAYLKQEGTKASLKELRQLQHQPYPDWALDCPQRLREHAFADAAKAMKNAKAKCKQTGQFQNVSFRRKKDPKQGFGFDAASIQDDSLFALLKHRLHFQLSEELPQERLEGTRIVRENGRWFAIVPTKRQVMKPESQRQPVVALDPGVRTFMSLYGIGFYGDFGKGDFGRIQRLCYHLDELMGKIAKAKSKKRRRLKRASERLRWRIRHLVDELHKKLAYFLVTRFEVILLPTFETQEMVSKLHSKTARAMMTWAHYRFKQHLKAKAEEYSAIVIDANEAYTSKTCSYCGNIQHIGGKKRMRCSCGVDVDRDHQGARGIFLRALSVTTPSDEGLPLAGVHHLLAKM